MGEGVLAVMVSSCSEVGEIVGAASGGGKINRLRLEERRVGGKPLVDTSPSSLSSSTDGLSSTTQPPGAEKVGSLDLTKSQVIRGRDSHDTRGMDQAHEVVAG